MNHPQRYFAAAILAMCCFVHSSCLSYRLNYVAQIEVNSDKGGDQLTSKNSQGEGPASGLIAKNVYRYKHGATYTTSLLPLGCAATYWFYGGFCWAYFGLPFTKDELDLEKRATTNLQILFAGREFRILEIEYQKVEQDRDQPYYLLIDGDDSILAKGNAPARYSLADASHCGEAEEKEVAETSEAATEQTEDKEAGGLSEAADRQGFQFQKEPDEGAEAPALFKRGFITGHLHVSAVLGLGVQVGYRLTEKDALALSYFYDWYTENSSNSFVGASYQRYFANSYFVQTGLGRLESKNKYYERGESGSYWDGRFRSSSLIGPSANLIIGKERLWVESNLVVGFDFIGYHLGISPQQRGIIWPKLRIGKVF